MSKKYEDMARNYPGIYAQLVKGFWDDRNSDWNKPPITPIFYFSRRKSHTTGVAKSARRTSAGKKVHLLERYCNFVELPEFPLKNKELVLFFNGSENFGYIANTNAGYFVADYIEHGNHDLDYAICQFKRHDGTVVMSTRGKTIPGAISACCAKVWARHEELGKNYSLYSFYKAIYFHFSDKPKKIPRSHTRTIKMRKMFTKLF